MATFYSFRRETFTSFYRSHNLLTAQKILGHRADSDSWEYYDYGFGDFDVSAGR